MPYDQSPKKRKAQSTPTKHKDESDDDFEDIDAESYSSDDNESDMLLEEEEEHIFSSSEDEQPKYVRSSRRSSRKFMKILQISDDEDSDDNEDLTDLMENELTDSVYNKSDRPIVFYRNAQLGGMKSDKILYRQKLSISSWLSILEKTNTQYITKGSLINPTRFSTWESLSAEEQQTEVELFLIHWKNLSYLHCSWESYDDLMKQHGPYIKQRFQRFYRTENEILSETTGYGVEDYFNPDFTEIDRILDVRVIQEDLASPLPSSNNKEVMDMIQEGGVEKTDRLTKEYLIKWKQLPYCEISWECYDDFQNKEAVALYYSHLRRDISDLVHECDYRPSLSLYKKISTEITYKNGNQLRSYQVEGINWLLWNWINGRNSILADEMGLGKTVQGSMFIYNILYQYKLKPPFLVVAPLSTIPHWEAEIRRWTDMHVVVLHGSAESRKNIRQHEWKSATGEFDVLITTFEIAIAEAKLLTTISWAGVIVDEAHRLKGKNNKLGDILRRIDFGCKLLLTGTPLQNNTEELWSLLNFLQPEKFEDAEQFQNEFGDMKNSKQLEALHSMLKPYMLRRMKEDVEKSLKPKEETVINVELTAMQKKFYRAVYDHNTSVFVGQDSKNLPSLMNIMMELRKCCNHPFLIRGVEETVIEESYDLENRPKVIPKTTQELLPEVALKHILNTSGKMVLLDKLLPKLQSQGHRVLLFSQMVRMLDIIQDYLSIKGYTFERIDGSVKVSDRQAAIERFSAPGSDRFIFLICTRAGGFGINLTAADTVIIYDSDWNPQNDIQAQARCHRIGQDKAVKVYRLITNRTYEMEMFQRANLKLGLDKAVLNPLKQSIRADGGVDMVKMSKKDAETLLKYGAYDFFKEEREGKTEELSNAFCEADIDQILEKNTKVITIDSQGGSSFSKASFITDTSAEVDINDPNFWTKIVGLKDHSQDNIGPRHRKRIEYHSVAEEDGVPGNETGFEDDNDWIKTDRDVLLKLLLAFGWGQWDSISSNERMLRHSRNSIRMIASAIVGQLARLTILADEESDMKKLHATAVRSAQQGKEAILTLESTYSICHLLKESNDLAETGKESGILFPHRYPDLVRDTAWLNKMTRVCSRYLKHLSFLNSLQSCITAFRIQPGATVLFPKLRRAVLPAPWWKMEEDRDSILGVSIHGWGNWKAICEDPNLCFKQKGVIYTSQSTEEDENLMEVENEQEGEGEQTPISSVSDQSKVLPSNPLLTKRIRRLVDTMEATLTKGVPLKTNTYSPTQPTTPKKPKKSDVVFIGEWVVKEAKSYRNAILQWGLPIPPAKLSDAELFNTNRVPLYSDVKEREKFNAEVCDVVDSLICQVHDSLTPPTLSQPITPTRTAREASSPYHYHCCPLCLKANAPTNSTKYCIYCDCYVGYQILRAESNIQKSYVEMQFMGRFIEESAIQICELPTKTNLKSNDTQSEIKSKLPPNIDIVIPSTILAQRIQSRLQLYYDLQQLIFKKDKNLIKAFIQQWTNTVSHQEVLSTGWIPYIHDVYLFEGVYRWGVVEWEIVWKDPLLPFFINTSEDAKKKKTRKKKKGKAGETPEGETPEIETPTVEEAPVQDMKEKYTYEDAVRLKDPSVDRSQLVAGLSALYVLKRINTILRFFKQYNSFAVISSINAPLFEKAVIVRKEQRRVRIVLQGKVTQTSTQVELTEELFWKKNQRINHPLYTLKKTPDLTYKPLPTRTSDAWTVSHEPNPTAIQPLYRPTVLPFPNMYSLPYPKGVNTVAVRPTLREPVMQCFLESRRFLQATQFPLKIHECTIYYLGKVIYESPAYHSSDYIWPVGYKSTRPFTSFMNPPMQVEYTSEIIDTGSGPLFRVRAADSQEHFLSNDATSSWMMVIEKVKEAEVKKGINRNIPCVGGPELFGFGYMEVSFCIEGLEGADHCKNYVCRRLREKPLHVSGYFPPMANKRNPSINEILYNDKQIKR